MTLEGADLASASILLTLVEHAPNRPPALVRMAPAPPPSPRSAEYAYSTSLRKGLPHAAADLSHSAQAALDRAEESLVELAVKVGLKDDSPVVANGNGQHANGNGHHANGNVDVKLVAVAADGPETPSEAFSKLSVQVRLFQLKPCPSGQALHSC